MIETATATLKMFTVEGGGDPQILYNLTGRPLFIGLGSLLFVIGLVVSVVRFKRPAYAFMLIWLAVTLLPNLVTAPAPFFYRAIATQTPVAVMPAIATVARMWLRPGSLAAARSSRRPIRDERHWSLYWSRWFRWARRRSRPGTITSTCGAAIKMCAFSTRRPMPKLRMRSTSSTDTSPVAVSGYFIEDADPIIFEQALNRSDVPVRWFDARDAIIAGRQCSRPNAWRFRRTRRWPMN